MKKIRREIGNAVTESWFIFDHLCLVLLFSLSLRDKESGVFLSLDPLLVDTQKCESTNCSLYSSPRASKNLSWEMSREIWALVRWREFYQYSFTHTTHIVKVQSWLKIGMLYPFDKKLF